jgi:hypothetical protein
MMFNTERVINFATLFFCASMNSYRKAWSMIVPGAPYDTSLHILDAAGQVICLSTIVMLSVCAPRVMKIAVWMIATLCMMCLFSVNASTRHFYRESTMRNNVDMVVRSIHAVVIMSCATFHILETLNPAAPVCFDRAALMQAVLCLAMALLAGSRSGPWWWLVSRAAAGSYIVYLIRSLYIYHRIA